MVNRNLIYLSYGSESEYRRTIFSVLSYFSWCGNLVESTRIIIYTDAPEYFGDFFPDRAVEYYLLSPELLDEMKGADQFVHRIKVSVINLTFENYPDENQLFVDSDTFFTANATQLINSIATGISIMHVREYAIEESLEMFASYNQAHFPRSFMMYINNHAFKVGKEMISFDNQDYSWNSGVLGLHKDFAGYMPDILKLTDQFYANSKWFISEQLAFSFILQRKTEIKPAADYILHYWGKRQKKLLDHLLAGYLKTGQGIVFEDTASFKIKTRSYMKAIGNDLILEQIEIAIDLKSWIYAFKKCSQFLLSNPMNLKLYIELFSTLKGKIKRADIINGVV